MDLNGNLELLTVGTIPFLNPLGTLFWIVMVALNRAFTEGFRDVILETDNHEAYKVMKNFHLGAPAGVYDVASQIDIKAKDKRWKCKITYVYHSRNKYAHFLACLGLETADRLYTFDIPVGGVEEMLNWDMGLGIDHPDFQDVYLPTEAPDPVNFDIVTNLSDQIGNLGLGQINAPSVISLDMALNADLLHLEPGVEEDFFHGGALFHADQVAFEGDTPIQDVDKGWLKMGVPGHVV